MKILEELRNLWSLLPKTHCPMKILTKEMYKFGNDLSPPPLIDDMFQVWKDTLNVRYFQKFANNKKAL